MVCRCLINHKIDCTCIMPLIANSGMHKSEKSPGILYNMENGHLLTEVTATEKRHSVSSNCVSFKLLSILIYRKFSSCQFQEQSSQVCQSVTCVVCL